VAVGCTTQPVVHHETRRPLFGHLCFRPSWIKHSPVVATSRVCVLHVSNQPVKSSTYTNSVYKCLCTLTCFKPPDEYLPNLVCSSTHYKPPEATSVTFNLRDFRASPRRETFALLGCYATYSGGYRRFGTTYLYHVQEALEYGTDVPKRRQLSIHDGLHAQERRPQFLASYHQYCQHGGNVKLQQTQQ
jgi:hypothetical protein